MAATQRIQPCGRGKDESRKFKVSIRMRRMPGCWRQTGWSVVLLWFPRHHNHLLSLQEMRCCVFVCAYPFGLGLVFLLFSLLALTPPTQSGPISETAHKLPQWEHSLFAFMKLHLFVFSQLTSLFGGACSFCHCIRDWLWWLHSYTLLDSDSKWVPFTSVATFLAHF